MARSTEQQFPTQGPLLTEAVLGHIVDNWDTCKSDTNSYLGDEDFDFLDFENKSSRIKVLEKALYEKKSFLTFGEIRNYISLDRILGKQGLHLVHISCVRAFTYNFKVFPQNPNYFYTQYIENRVLDFCKPTILNLPIRVFSRKASDYQKYVSLFFIDRC